MFCSALLVACSETTKQEGVASNRSGKELYQNNCTACHGEDGKLGAGGASDLSSSTLKEEEIKTIIEKGRKGMPAHSHIYENEQELNAIKDHVKGLRKK